MVKGKLILICQSGGEFSTNDDGLMSYTGGDAHAVEINPETQFDDLKLKLAELCNLEYRSLSIKYFLPGNRKTLICLSNDKDLKRMYDFHGNSVTADLFISGREGFDREALNMNNRAGEIKLAETVVPTATAASRKTSRKPVTCISTPSDSVIGVKLTPHRPSTVGISSNYSPTHTVTKDHDVACSRQTGSAAVAFTAGSHSPIVSDMDSTPADTVKKRRRTASWAISVNGPRIVAVPEKTEEKRKVVSQKKKIKYHENNAEHQQNTRPNKDNADNLMLPSTADIATEKLVELWKDAITGVGQDFKSVYEFRDALQKYAIAHRFAYKLIKNDTNRASGVCQVKGCPWRIHASWVSSARSFRIKRMDTSHTCEGGSWKSAHPTKNWLVSIIKDRLKDSPHRKPKEIANEILQNFGIELNYTQVWRGMEDAREQLQGSYKEAYSQLPWFCEKMVEANPGSVIMLVTKDDNKFQRLFLSFHALIHGFQVGCRPLLFLNATSLKSKYHEVLLTATSLDGNDCTFPIAFCIVDDESDDNWHWFLEQLKSVVPTSQPVTFVSDREKGLRKSVFDVFSNAHHGYSLYHLLESFKKNLKGPFHGDGKPSLPINFLAASHALRLEAFKASLEQIKKVSSGAYYWVMQIEPEQWTSAAFKGEPYNHIMFDVSEIYANWIEEVRELTITQKVEALRYKTMELINDGRIDSCSWSTKLTPLKEEKLLEESHKAQGLKVLFSSDTLFEVHDDSIHVVDIEKWDCTCLKWKVTGIPCCHAIAVLNCTNRNMYDYCLKYFTVDTFIRMYSESINPISESIKSGVEAAEGTETVLPPHPRKQQDQHKKEESKSAQAVKKTVSCTKCGETGHNKASCK